MMERRQQAQQKCSAVKLARQVLKGRTALLRMGVTQFHGNMLMVKLERWT